LVYAVLTPRRAISLLIDIAHSANPGHPTPNTIRPHCRTGATGAARY
jgi:hypothetical protein